MILLNDDFSAIVDGVEEGRKLYDNLKKSVMYVLNNNIMEIYPFFANIIFAIPLPLNTMLMICISVGTDILPTIALAFEAGESDIMIRRPRTKADGLITARSIAQGYLQMGIIASAGSHFAWFSTMQLYGFTAMGQFHYRTGNRPGAVRCTLNSDAACISTQLAFDTYNVNAYDLGNPYLSIANIGQMTNDNRAGYYASACAGGDPDTFTTVGDSSCPNYNAVDLNFQGDI
jgi:magnesium-transporting ATPase (P-type)